MAIKNPGSRELSGFFVLFFEVIEMIPMSLIVNRAAVERVAGIPARKIQKLLVSDCGEWVLVLLKPTKRIPEPEPETVAVADLETNFHEFRKESGRDLIVLPGIVDRATGDVIHIVEGGGGDPYKIRETDTQLICSCEDWHQHETLCKHGWAVLLNLKCESLLELWKLRTNERLGKPSIAQTIAQAPQRSHPRPTTIKGVSIE